MCLDHTTGKPRRQRIFDFPRLRRFEAGVRPAQREWRWEASGRDATTPGTAVTSPPRGELQQVHARERRFAHSCPGEESQPSATLEMQRGRGNSGGTTGSRGTSRSLQRSPEPTPKPAERRRGTVAARVSGMPCARWILSRGTTPNRYATSIESSRVRQKWIRIATASRFDQKYCCTTESNSSLSSTSVGGRYRRSRTCRRKSSGISSPYRDR